MFMIQQHSARRGCGYFYIDDAMHREWLLIVLLSAAGCRNTEAKGSKQLTLAVFMSGVFTNQSEIAGGQTFLTGLDLTLELLNNDSRLLPGYFLNASIADPRVSGCTVPLIRL